MDAGLVFLELAKGFGVSLIIFFCTLLFSLPLGMLVCAARTSRFKPLAWLTSGFIWIIRGTPLMLQIMVVYYGPLILGASYGGTQEVRTLFCVIAFVINYSAYFAEIYRGGIESLGKGQREAAAVLGLSKTQTFRRVLLPQMVKKVLPPMSNEIITLVKDTSLARIISVGEIILVADSFQGRGLIWPIFAAGIFYLLFNGILTVIFHFAERKFAYYRD